MLGSNENRAVAAIQIRADGGSSEFVIESERRENGHRIEWVRKSEFLYGSIRGKWVKESCQKFGEDNHDVGFIL